MIQSAIMLCVILLNVSNLSVIKQSDIVMCVVLMNFIIISVIVQSDIYAMSCADECDYPKCH
jgi:hypothetical protein